MPPKHILFTSELYKAGGVITYLTRAVGLAIKINGSGIRVKDADGRTQLHLVKGTDLEECHTLDPVSYNEFVRITKNLITDDKGRYRRLIFPFAFGYIYKLRIEVTVDEVDCTLERVDFLDLRPSDGAALTQNLLAYPKLYF